jgi:hypothetical protein
MGGKDNGHPAQLLTSNHFQRSKDVALVFDEKFRIGRNAEEALGQPDFLYPARYARVAKFLPDLLHLRAMIGRKQHLHICVCITLLLWQHKCNSGPC